MFLKTKILTAFLLLLSALPVICTIVYLVKLEINAFAMEEKLEQASLQTVTVSCNQLVWVKKNKEVLINGKLFDVKSTFIGNGNIRLTGLFDADEEKILQNMHKMGGNDQQSSLVCSILAHMLCPAILQKSIQAVPAENVALKNTSFPCLRSLIYDNPCVRVTTPPPNTTANI